MYNVVGGFAGGGHPQTGRRIAGWAEAGLPVTSGTPDQTGYQALRRKAGL